MKEKNGVLFSLSDIPSITKDCCPKNVVSFLGKCNNSPILKSYEQVTNSYYLEYYGFPNITQPHIKRVKIIIDFEFMAKFLLLILVFVGAVGAEREECREKYCYPYLAHHLTKPRIKFPFRLKNHQPDYCGHPSSAFHISCNGTNPFPIIDLQIPLTTELSIFTKALIHSINYESQSMIVRTMNDLEYNNSNSFSSSTPFKLANHHQDHQFILVSCYLTSSCGFPADTYYEYGYLRDICPSDKIIAYPSQVYSLDRAAGYAYCRRLYNTSFEIYPSELRYIFKITWSKPNCSNCEAQGKYCRFKNHYNNHTITAATVNHNEITECFDIPYPPPQPLSTGRWPPEPKRDSDKVVLTGIIGGLFLYVLLIVSVYGVMILKKMKKEDQVKIEKFLEDYRTLKPTRYSYSDIKKITAQFQERLGQGGFGTVFKGKLSDDVTVAVKVLNGDPKGNGDDFINEVRTIGLIHHVNVVRLVGYCADGSHRALIYEFLPNGSLEKYVLSGKNNNKNHFLGWNKMKDIAVGIAKGIEYLHQGCALRILHFDIKPNNILLDQNFNPKVADFGLAKLCSKEKSVVTMTAGRGTIGYVAPEVFSRNFGKASSKSDVYSFGMLLLEMVGGKNENNWREDEHESEVYFPEWIYTRLDQGGEIGIQIEEDGDPDVAKRLTIVGLWCIRWHPIDRPSMKVVIQMLEGEVIPTMPPNPFATTSEMNTGMTSRTRGFSELDVISESDDESILLH